MAVNIFEMAFAKVYPCLIAKAERKGRTRDEVLLVTSWMTGYSPEQLEEMLLSDAIDWLYRPVPEAADMWEEAIADI